MTEALKAYLAAGFTSALGLLVFFLGFGRMRKYQLMRDIPQSKIRSMAIGLVEVSGNVVPEAHLTSPLSNTDCVYYRYTIEEYREQATSKGGTESRWDTIADEERRIPFFLRDDTGQVIVEPTGAEFSLPPKKIFFKEGNMQLGGFVPDIVGAVQQAKDVIRAAEEGSMSETPSAAVHTEGLVLVDPKSLRWKHYRSGDRKYSEYYIEPDALLYIIGSAANRSMTTSELMIHKGENEPTFIISDKSEKGLLRRLLLETWLCFILGGLFFTIGIYLIFKTFNIF